MKIRKVIFGAVIIWSLVGCNQPPNLFETGRYSLEVDKVEDCTLEAISFEKDGKLFVESRMTLRHHRDAPLSGDGQIQIYGPDGNLLLTKTVPFEPLPHSRHGHPAARLQFVFDQIPPPGSVIKLMHTLRPYDGSIERVIR